MERNRAVQPGKGSEGGGDSGVQGGKTRGRSVFIIEGGNIYRCMVVVISPSLITFAAVTQS